MSLPFLGRHEEVCWELLCYADRPEQGEECLMLPHVPHRVQPAVLVALVGKIKSLQKSLKMKQMLRLIPDVLQFNIFNLIQVFKMRVKSQI